MKRILAAVDWISGEWMLDSRANSGAIVFLRSVKVSFLIFFLAVITISAIDPARTNEISGKAFLSVVVDKFPWLGATFAATYAAFYTRYASQWSYMASLYNQIMATRSALSADQKSNISFLNWQAGFVEDAMFLHLDRKPIFAVPIGYLLHDPEILKAFIESSPPELVEKALSRHIPDLVKSVRTFQEKISQTPKS